MKAPFPLATCACALGIVVADAGEIDFTAARIFAIAALVVGRFSGSWPRLRASFALLTIAGCGALAMASERLDSDGVRLREPADAVVEATVCDRDVRASLLSVDLCDCAAVEPGGARVPRRLRLFEAVDGESRLVLEALREGERIRARLRLSPIRPPANPGAPDRYSHYARRGIGARATLRDPSMLVRMGPLEPPGSLVERLAKAISERRQRIGVRLSAEGEGGSFARALALGDRSGLSDAAREAFTRLGVGHLLAVSGLHVALVAGFAFALTRRVSLFVPRFAVRHDPRRMALAGAFVCAGFYAGMSGWGIPVRRALLFLAVLCVSVASARTTRGLQLLSLAAMPLLLLEPSALFEMGAQLSFVASAALLLARHDPGGSDSGLAALLRTSTTAIVATAPIVAAHGGGVGAYGFAANLVAVPWVGLLVLPMSLVAAIAGALPENVGSDLAIRGAAALAQFTLDVAIAVASVLPAAAKAGARPGTIVVATAMLLTAVALFVRPTARRLGVALAQCALLALAPAQSIGPEGPRVVVFDVGQGDATLIQGRTGSILVDGGRAIEGAFDLGKRVVLPGLVALGVDRIDLAIVSHGDVDHRGGVTAVLEGVEVGELWLPFGGRSLPEFDGLVDVAKRKGIPVIERGRGSEVAVRGDLRVQPLWPPRVGGPRGRNERSLVVRVETLGSAGESVLLTGDLGAPGELELLASGAALRSTIRKVGHHGSAGSSTGRFLEAVAPAVAIVSAPCHGRSGLPNSQALTRLADTEAQVWWTGESGAVIVGMATPFRGRITSGWHAKSECWAH